MGGMRRSADIRALIAPSPTSTTSASGISAFSAIRRAVRLEVEWLPEAFQADRADHPVGALETHVHTRVEVTVEPAEEAPIEEAPIEEAPIEEAPIKK